MCRPLPCWPTGPSRRLGSLQFAGWILSLLLLAGCAHNPPPPAPALTLATTTSTRDSGLLDALLPAFQQQTAIPVHVVAVGSGQALALGRRGDADVLLTHAPQAEQQFMAEGFGLERWPVMHNDFILVGPPSDPAAIASAQSVFEALCRIACAQALFVSRGDKSGTHLKEEQLWRAAGITPQRAWHIRAGAGMAPALRMASEKQAYTLTDRGTFLAQRHKLELTILHEGDRQLQNHYAVLLINPQRHPHVNHAAARQFAAFLRSPTTQAMIGRFGVERFGQPLFFPQAAESE